MRLSALVLSLAVLAGPACSQGGGQTVPATIDAAYREALRTSPLPLDVEAEHGWWVKDGSDAEDEFYLERLQRRVLVDRRTRTIRPLAEDLPQGCVQIELLGCTATGGGFLRSGETVLWFQTQSGYTEEDGVGGAVAVFEQPGGEGPLVPLVWTSEGSQYDAPVLRQDGDEPLLLILPGISRGTGSGDMLRMLVFRDGRWRQVDTDWQSRAGGMLNGRVVNQRPFWDFQQLRAWTPTWKDGDGGCCGTGGDVLLDFSVIQDKLTLVQVRERVAE